MSMSTLQKLYRASWVYLKLFQLLLLQYHPFQFSVTKKKNYIDIKPLNSMYTQIFRDQHTKNDLKQLLLFTPSKVAPYPLHCLVYYNQTQLNTKNPPKSV